MIELYELDGGAGRDDVHGQYLARQGGMPKTALFWDDCESALVEDVLDIRTEQ